MPLSRNPGPISEISRLKNFKVTIPFSGRQVLCFSFLWVMELLKIDKAPPLLKVAPTSPGIAADNASTALSVIRMEIILERSDTVKRQRTFKLRE